MSRPHERDEMAEVVFFHHAMGQTAGFHTFADALRGAGHTVHTPDLFEGRTFGSIDEGVAFVGEVGWGEIVERGVAAADGLSDELVYGGFSLGVLPAQKLAQRRPRRPRRAARLLRVPVSEFGEAWPEGVPVQIHGADADPYFVDEGDLGAAHELVGSAYDAELCLYPGDQHYFADSSLPSYDEGATKLLTERVLAFLGRV